MSEVSNFSLGLRVKIVGRTDKYNDLIRLECRTDDHYKYYVIEYVRGNSNAHKFGSSAHVVRVTYGKIGSVGGTKNNPFSSEELARKFMMEKIKEKKKKGYLETLKTK